MISRTDTLAEFEPANVLTKLRNGFLWAGVLMLILGAAAVLMPLASSLVIEILIGWLLAISGGVTLVGAFSMRGSRQFTWQLITGLVSLAAGLLMLVYPQHGLVALTVVVAVVLIWTGAAQMAFSFWIRPTSAWVWGLVSAILSLILGAYILVALPEASAVILGLLVGIDFISTGMALILISRSVRQLL